MDLCTKFARGCNNSAGLQKTVKINTSAVCKKLRRPAYFSLKINCACAIITNTRVWLLRQPRNENGVALHTNMAFHLSI